MLSIFKKNGKKHATLKYDKKFISKLSKDHQKLLELIKDTHKTIESDNIKKSKKSILKLRTVILEHCMEEDIKLFLYLKKYYEEETNTLNTIEMLESTIKNIQKSTLSFLSQYSKKEAELDAEFKIKFLTVFKEFGTRIKTEESKLYTLYVK